MANRREQEEFQTKRPTPPRSAVLSIRDVLAIPEVRAGDPAVLAGEDALSNGIHWVHCSDSPHVAALLNGGELLLSTGSSWPHEPDALRTFVASLIAADVRGILLETVRHHTSAPAALIEACTHAGLPLITLSTEVKFVTITQAVHGRILDWHTSAAQARAHTHALFTELSLRGSPAAYVVAQLGDTLGCPVVLEDIAHRVVALGGPGADSANTLHDWERRSRHTLRDNHHERWERVPVHARGTRLGTLVALPGPEHPAGRVTVLEQAALSLALGAHGEHHPKTWTTRHQRSLIATLLEGTFPSVAALSAHLEAAGLAVRERMLFGGILARPATPATLAALRRAATAANAQVIAGAHPQRPQLLVVALSLPRELGEVGPRVIDRIVRSIPREPAAPGTFGEGAAFGSPAHTAAELLESLAEAEALVGWASTRSGFETDTVMHATERPLVRLVTSLADDPRLLEHAERMLGPLIQYDQEHGGDLLHVLGAFVRHPTNRTRAAKHSRLSRSVFYQRIAHIESLLGVSLDDGETMSALHVAVLARGASTARGVNSARGA